MKDARLPEFDEIMDRARRSGSKIDVSSETATLPRLADSVLRELRSSRRLDLSTDTLADWIQISKRVAAIGCALSLAVVTFVPKIHTEKEDQPNVLSALGGW